MFALNNRQGQNDGGSNLMERESQAESVLKAVQTSLMKAIEQVSTTPFKLSPSAALLLLLLLSYSCTLLLLLLSCCCTSSHQIWQKVQQHFNCITAV